MSDQDSTTAPAASGSTSGLTSGPTSGPTLMIPALGGLYEGLAPYGYTFLRVVLGLFLIPHGAQKLFGWFGGGGLERTAGFVSSIGFEPGAFWAIMVGGAEFFGGLALLIGFLTRPAALAAIAVMVVAVVKVHFGNGYFNYAKGYEYPMMWGFLLCIVLVKGGGEHSTDARLGREF